MRTIYRHAYKVKFKRPPLDDRWKRDEYLRRVKAAEAWCEEHAQRDWSHRGGELGTFWFENADDAVRLKLAIL